MTPGTVLAYASPVASVTGRASSSVRSSTTGPGPLSSTPTIPWPPPTERVTVHPSSVSRAARRRCGAHGRRVRGGRAGRGTARRRSGGRGAAGGRPRGSRATEPRPPGPRTPGGRPAGPRTPGGRPAGPRTPQVRPPGPRTPQVRPPGPRTPGVRPPASVLRPPCARRRPRSASLSPLWPPRTSSLLDEPAPYGCHPPLRPSATGCQRGDSERAADLTAAAPAMGPAPGRRAGTVKPGPHETREITMAPKTELATLADEILELESETFEISDYSDASEVVLAARRPAPRRRPAPAPPAPPPAAPDTAARSARAPVPSAARRRGARAVLARAREGARARARKRARVRSREGVRGGLDLRLREVVGPPLKPSAARSASGACAGPAACSSRSPAAAVRGRGRRRCADPCGAAPGSSGRRR